MSLIAHDEISITGLPTVLIRLFERAQRQLLPDPSQRIGLFVRYLRRKADRGLAVIYSVDALHAAHQQRSSAPERAVSLTLGELALDGAQIRFTHADVEAAEVEVLSSGVLHVASLDLSVQKFPADAKLTALAASCDTQPGSPVFEVLSAAARLYLSDAAWQVVAAQAEPVRYKPGSRCVIRYRLELAHPDRQHAEPESLILFGKVYADPAQAQRVQAVQQLLYTEQQQADGLPFLPHPLGLVDALGLTVNEAIAPAASASQPGDLWAKLRTGTHAFRPCLEHGKGGVITRVPIPANELTMTAQALARLHTSAVPPIEAAPRSGKKEAKRARERASLIASRNVEQAEHIGELSQRLSALLEQSEPEVYRPAHGGFKASQLLFHSQRVFVVDFDGFCVADPALDVGYFLAYLRPSALWYKRPGMRQWFEAAAGTFRNAYAQAMNEMGVAPPTIEGILTRSRLYEAALIFKIATRRVNRLNSSRPQELAAMLQEIAACLPAESGENNAVIQISLS